MKKRSLLFMALAMFFFIANSQTVTVDIQESNGGCGLATDCEADIGCFDLIVTVNEANWELASYNIWTKYPAPPVMSRIYDNACITQNGGDTDDNLNGQYRVAGINGVTTLAVNSPLVFHTICFEYPDPEIIQDSVIASGGTLLLYGIPFSSTMTLVHTITGTTAGFTIPQQYFLDLNGATFSCLTPDIMIKKELTANADGDGSGTISLGDVLTYTVTATNTGGLAQSNVVVSDSKLSPASSSCATLSVGDSCVLVGTYTVTQADVDAGEIVNTGSVVSDQVGPFEDQITTPVPNTPEISILKSLLTDISGGVSVGDVLNYLVEVTNTGNVTLNNVVVSDPKLAPKTKTCTTLAPNAVCTLSGLYLVSQADMNAGQIINNATGNSDETLEVSDQLITPLPQDPQISITKSLITDVSGGIDLGDVLVYYAEVTNIGNITLHNVTVSDPMLTPNLKTCATVAPNGICTLTGTYKVKQSDMDAGQIVNTATGDSDETASKTDQVITPITQTPQITTAKSLLTDVSGGVISGDVITYEVVVTNTGNVTLNNVTVSDPKLTPMQTSCATLAPGNTCTLTGTYTISQTDIDAGQVVNEGIGDSDETPPVPDEIITPLPSAPQITTTKTLLTDISGGVSVGDVLLYEVEVLNSGDITLNNVTVVDAKLTPGSKSCATLAPGNICNLVGVYTVTQADIDAGQIVNTGIGDSDETDPKPDQITTPITQTPQTTTVKTLLTDISGGVALGDVLTYEVSVTNSGNVTLNNVTVTDAKLTPALESCATLAPGDACTLTGTYTVSQSDLDAGQIVNEGIGDSDETPPQPEEIITPIPQNPKTTTVKTLLTDISGGVAVGDVLTYEVSVSNTGDITLNNVSVTDTKLTPALASCATLAPGDACTLTGTYTVSQSDLDAGQIVNEGIGDSDETPPQPEEIITPLPQNPAITTVKTLLTDIAAGIEVGDVLSYEIVVTNSGDITLNSVTVSDALLTPGFTSCATLAPGDACTLAGTYTVLQSDLDAGQIVNTGIGDSDETDPDPDQVITPTTQTPETTTLKTLLTDVSGGIDVGDVLVYQVEVLNSGNITLNNVSITDTKLSPAFKSCATVAPGNSCTLMGIYQVTQADIDAGQIVNTGIGDSDETDPDPDQIITPIPQTPAITTAKTLLTDISSGVSVGDVLTYKVEVSNTGNITLNNVTVTDAKLTPAFASCATLAPGDACTLTGIYTVSQSDLDAGQIVNEGIGDSDETPPQPKEIITPLPQNPATATVKTLLTDVSGGIEVGDILTYEVVLTNSGDITLNNVTVTDTKLIPALASCATLAPGDACTLTGTYTVSQSDIDAGQIVNTGVGDSDETDPDPDQVITPVPQTTELKTVKTLLTDISGGVYAGDIFTYSIEVTNTGNVTLHNVTARDPMISPSLASCPTLASSQTCTLTGDYTVTQADIQTGQIVNTGTGDSDETLPQSDQLSVPLVQVPEITTVKQLLTDVSAGIAVDDILTYYVTVVNSGNLILNNVTVNDPKLTPSSSSCATLVPGDVCELTGTYKVTQADVDAGQIVNTAYGNSDETPQDSDQLITPIDNITPDIAIVKTLTTDISGGVSAGDVLTYAVEVTNTGNITLNNVLVEDVKLTPNSKLCSTVAPGGSCVLTGTYIVSLADVDAGQIVNTGTGNSDQAGPVSDQLTTPLQQVPAITTTKTLQTDISGGVSVGDMLIYTVEVLNSGNVTLHNVTASDLMLTPNSANCATLTPGNTCTLTGSYFVTQADIDAGQIINEGIGDSDETPPQPEEITTPLPQNPETTTVKTLLTDISGGVSVGDVLTYQVEVTNSGNITLNNVSVEDAKLTPSSTNCTILSPGDACTLTGTYTISQADLDAGEIVNQGIGDSDETPPQPEEIITPLPQNPATTTVKTLLTDVSGGIAVGDVLSYQVEVTNSGDITLNNVTVTDDKLTPNMSNCAVLAPGDVCTLSGTYMVTQADLDAGQIVNTGIGDSDETDPDPDQIITPVPQNPETTTVKTLLTDVSGGIAVGDVLTYQVEVSNSGDVTLNNVTVTDVKLTPNFTTCTTLAPGDACILTGTYTVSQADIDAGQIVNTGIGNSDETDPDPDEVTTPIDQEPKLSVVKTLVTDISGGVFAGDVLTYTVEVTNTGDITLHNVTATDVMISPNSATCPTLAPTEVCTLTGTYTVTQADVQAGQIVNTGVGNSDETLPEVDELITPLQQISALNTVKQLLTDVSGGISDGDILTYKVDVTNTGNMILNNVVVNDPKLTPASSSCATLVPGNVCSLTGTYTVTQADIDAGQIVNTATGDSDETAPDSDQLITPISNITPDIAIVKTMTTDISGGVFAGDLLTYTIEVTNTGNITLNNVLVSDPMLTPNSSFCATVAPAETCVLTGTYQVTLADMDAGQIVNTATGTSDQVGSVDDQLTTTLQQTPEITTVKTLLTDISGGVSVGELLTYEVEVTNTGNITLNNVSVSDPMLTPDATSCATLIPGDACILTGTYEVTLADIDAGQIVNTGTGDSDETGPDSDQITTILPSDPQISVVKTLLTDIAGGVDVGDVLTYSIVTTNTGNITLNNVTVTDPLLTPAATSCASLIPLESCTLTGTYTVKQADIDAGVIINTGIGDSDETDSESDQLITILPQGPDITTIKTLLTDVSGGIEVNDVLTYRIAVTNTGDMTLNNVTVSDAMLNPDFASCSTLAPGSQCTLIGTYTVTQADKDAGQIVNTGIGNSDETDPESDVLIIPVSQNPETTTVKTLLTDISGGVFVNDVLTYQVEVANSGDVTLNNVTVTDVKLTPNNAACATLAPGEVCTLTGTYTVSQADVNAGQIVNTGIGNSDETDPDPDVLTTPVSQDSELAVVKTLLTDISGGVHAGDIITYSIQVTNIGNITLHNVTAFDPMLSPNLASCPTLEPSQTCTLIGEYTITQADIQKGEIRNTGIGNSIETDPVTDKLITPLIQTTEIAIEKQLLTDISGGVEPGDVLTYYIELTNVGNMIVNNIIVSDPMLTPIDNTCATLIPGAMCTLTGTYTVVQADVDAGEIVNTATGDCDETAPVTDQLITPVPQNPGIQIVKTLETDISGGVFAGDVLSYSVEITNTGNVTLTNVLIEDTKITPASASCLAVAPGETCKLVGTYTLTQADIDAAQIANTGIAYSDQLAPVNDELIVPLQQNPEITTTKTMITDISAGVFVGDVLTYTVEVENTGNMVLNNVSVTDNKITPNSTSCATIDPGDVCTLTGNYSVTQDDLNAGFIVNTATGDSDETAPDSDQLTTIVFSGPEIVANDDAGTPVNGYVGGLTFANVLANDTYDGNPVDPAAITLEQISTTHPGVSLNPATGQVFVAPGTPAGNYELVYEICEILIPANCDQATVTVPVTAAQIVANDDTGTPVNGFEGGVSVPNVLVNDELNGVLVDPAEITLVEISSEDPGVSLDPLTGEVLVAAGTPEGTYELVYEICEILNPHNCDQATVTVSVTAAQIIANNDTGTPVNGFEGGVSVPNVLVNDELNGLAVDPADITLVEISSEDPGVSLDPLTGEVIVAPGTPAGTYELVYEICEILNPDNCDQATVTATVTAAQIIANNDTGTPVNGYEGGVSVPNVLVNDELNGLPVDPADITLAEISSEDAGVSLDPLTGEVLVAPGTPAGTYELVYEICEILNPTNCDQATVTVSVTTAEIVANDDTGIPVNGYEGGVSVPNVLVNDELNGLPVDPADITLTEISSEDAGVSLDPLTGEVIVAPGTPAGTYELVYEICEILNPDNCDQATVTVTVTAAQIVANDDTGTPINGYSGGVSVPNVLVNDELNGSPVDPADITLTEISSENPGVTLDPLTGAVNVAPGTPAGTYELVYEICEILNPGNCDQATVFVEVLFSTIVANDDTGTPINGYNGGVSVPNVLVNDELNGLPVNPADITLTQISSGNPGVSLDPLTGEVIVAPGTPEGTYELVYEICEILNPHNCDQATVTVSVTAAEIIANDDTGIPVNGYEGGVSVPNVLVNDELNGLAVDPADITLVEISSEDPGVSLDPLTGEVIVAPGTPAGTYELFYTICEILNPDNCDQATVTVPVTAAEIIANDDTGIPVNGFEGGVSVPNVLVNDELNGLPVDPADITLTEISSEDPGVSLDPLTGEVLVAPGTPAGTYELVYEICEILNPDNCDQATVTVSVTAPEIIAVNDIGVPTNGLIGGVAVLDVLHNDSLNGALVDPADITLVGISSEHPGISLNPLTGEVIVAPGTPAGDYDLIYEICEIVNPDNCDQATVTVPVTAPEIIANDDAGVNINGVLGGVAVADVLANDLLNGDPVDPADITLIQISSTHAGVSLDPLTGKVLVAAGTPAGNYELVYEICEIPNPGNCDQATVTVSVFEEPAGTFCFNGQEAEAGNTSFFCSTEAIALTLCDILSGEAPFTICWEVDGVPDCEIIVYVGDTLFLEFLTPGNYEVKITSITDNLGNSATDLASYDFDITVTTGPESNAGSDAKICEGNNFVLSSATANNYSSLSWAGGDGVFFPSATDLNPLYIPGVQDLADGTVDLCLSALPNDPCTTTFTDCMTLTIQKNAVADAGATTINACETDVFVDLNGIATNSSSVLWTTDSFTGFFFDEFAPSTSYFFSPDDVQSGSVELCLTAYAINPCFISNTDCLTLILTQSPVANAGLDQEICEGLALTLSGASAENAATLEWTSNGDGTFDNPVAINPVYLPGENDNKNGFVQLCMTAYPLQGCSDFDSDCMNLTILKQPGSDLAPSRELVCNDYDVDNGEWLPVDLSNTITGDYISIEWTTDGDGTFDDIHAVSPNYYPGLADIWKGDIELCMNIEGSSVCNFSITQCMILYIPQQLIYFDVNDWWGISSYLETDLPSVAEVVDPLVLIPGSQYLITLVDQEGDYFWPHTIPPTGTLTDWEPVGYKLKIKNAPACLPIYGDSLIDQSFEVSGAFTFLPVLTNVPTNVEDLVEGHANEILLIYHWSKRELWTPVASDFDSLYPGYAYLLVNKTGGSNYTVTYPDFVPDAPHLYPIYGKDAATVNNSPWEDVKNTATPHIFLFSDYAKDMLQSGDVLGAFSQNGECYGMAEYGNKDELYKLVAMGYNGFSRDTRGFDVGEKVNFRIYRQSTGEEFDVEFIYDAEFPSSDGVFTTNGVSRVIDIRTSATSVTEISDDFDVNVYPNPANDVLNIVSGMAIREVQMLNSMGQLVYSGKLNEKTTQLDVSTFAPGFYFLHLKHQNDNVTIKRVTIQ